MATLNILNAAINVLIGLINVFGASQTVSNIIAQRIAAGRTDWTDDERNQVTQDLDSARQQAKDATGS